MRVGIFGGSFNPPHVGHIEVVRAVSMRIGLGTINVVPTSVNPLKPEIEGPSPEQRLEMTKLAFSQESIKINIDDQEIKRGGPSYSIETIKNLKKQSPKEDYYLILGMDQLDTLSQWKDWNKILEEVDLVFVSRPEFEFPTSIDELPSFLIPYVDSFDFNTIELKSKKTIQFVKIPEVQLSSTELRKWIRQKKNVSAYLPLSVESFIEKEKLYAPDKFKVSNYEKFTKELVRFLNDKKAISPCAYDLSMIEAPSQYTIICSGTSTRHASGLAENLIRYVKEETRLLPLSVEGIDEGRWVLIDFGTLIVHVFYDFVRQEYRLEDLWKKGKKLESL